MKRISITSFAAILIMVAIFIAPLNSNAQKDSIVKYLPSKYNSGVIICNYEWKYYFVFKASDYIEILYNDIKNESKTRRFYGVSISGDSTSHIDDFILLNEMYSANNRKISMLSEGMFVAFPSYFIFCKLFQKKRIIVLSNVSGDNFGKLVKYKVQYNRRSGGLTVVERSTKNIIFSRFYKGKIWN